MREAWARAWRVPATGLAFACFGLGGVLLGLTYFPLLTFLVRDPTARVPHARRAVQLTFAAFVRLMWLLGLVSFEIHGAEKLRRRGLLVLANHPTLVDVVFLVSLLRNADCVVRAGLADNLFTRFPVRASGYIRNHGGADLLDACIASLRDGGNLVIFPEGTRSRPGEALKLQRGAAQIATRGVRDITPVTIHCLPLGLTKGRPWWRTFDRPMHFTIDIGDDIAIAPFLERTAGEPALAARHLTAYLTEFFSEPRGNRAGT